MRRMYSKYSQIINKNTVCSKEDSQSTVVLMKPYHHIKLDREFKSDCGIWLKFLNDGNLVKIVNRPMIDIDMFQSSVQIQFFTDASAAVELGYGFIYGTRWTYGQWETGFINEDKPSIEFLELYALCAGILTWEKYLVDCRVVIWCDNMGVVGMVNSLASKCNKCMFLLRILTLNNLRFNRRISVKYIKSADNLLSDALSRLNLAKFRKFGKHMNKYPDPVNEQMRSPRALYNLSCDIF